MRTIVRKAEAIVTMLHPDGLQGINRHISTRLLVSPWLHGHCDGEPTTQEKEGENVVCIVQQTRVRNSIGG
eukprot:scaffold5315_cov63-Cylindrotheca_fusiformis.AAC.3